jgi:hypothetical protein
LVLAYEAFVESLRSGYQGNLYEYSNDLGVRDLLENRRSERDVAVMWERVERGDETLRSTLRPTERPISGDPPASRFWWWGYPPESAELMEDLKRDGRL